jgi:hypothetical protein
VLADASGATTIITNSTLIILLNQKGLTKKMLNISLLNENKPKLKYPEFHKDGTCKNIRCIISV